MNLTIGDFFVFIILSSPLIGILFYLIKAIFSNLNTKSEDMNAQPVTKFKLLKNNSILFLLLLFTLVFLILISIICFLPSMIEVIPLIWRIMGIFLFIIYWGCIAGIFIGLGNAVGAAGSGSATNIINKVLKDITSSKGK